jgi:hypothetical protein
VASNIGLTTQRDAGTETGDQDGKNRTVVMDVTIIAFAYVRILTCRCIYKHVQEALLGCGTAVCYCKDLDSVCVL